MSADLDLPEISDLVVAFDPDSLAREDVEQEAVVAELERHGLRAGARVVRSWPTEDGALVREHVDGVLVRSHLEMQRLSEEFQQGARMRRLLAPLVRAVADEGGAAPLRIVDVGCGLGYVTRWLAAERAFAARVELVGCDYNSALVTEAVALAEREKLACRFEVANAFTTLAGSAATPTIFTSTGVIHHFRGAALEQFFEEQAAARPLGFVHSDIKPSWLAPVGAWLFHQARMREPLAKIDGVLSAVRAHSGERLARAAASAAPEYALFLFDAEEERLPILKVMQALIGVHVDLAASFVAGLGELAGRVRRVSG
ncbi:MAG: class I SAM-dependent methyltransferase [Polyangiaceae bacterium]